MNKKFKLSILTLCCSYFLVKPLTLYASDEVIKPASINTQPSMAFFEYLAEQVEIEGELVGPIDMQNNKNNLLNKEIKTSSKHGASNKASSENEQQERGSHK